MIIGQLIHLDSLEYRAPTEISFDAESHDNFMEYDNHSALKPYSTSEQHAQKIAAAYSRQLERDFSAKETPVETKHAGMHCSGGGHTVGEKPNTGEKPAAGEKPNTGEKPAAGEKPNTGEKPAAGEKPNTSEKPSTGAKPGVGETPNVAVTPSTGSAAVQGSPTQEVSTISLLGGDAINVIGEDSARVAEVIARLYNSSSLFRSGIQQAMDDNGANEYTVYSVDDLPEGTLGRTVMGANGMLLNATSPEFKDNDFKMSQVIVHELGHNMRKYIPTPGLSTLGLESSSESVQDTGLIGVQDRYYTHEKAQSAMVAGIMYQLARNTDISQISGSDTFQTLDQYDPSIDLDVLTDSESVGSSETLTKLAPWYKDFRASVLSGDYAKGAELMSQLSETSTITMTEKTESGAIAYEKIKIPNLVVQELIKEVINKVLVPGAENVRAAAVEQLEGFSNYLDANHPDLAQFFQEAEGYFGFFNGIENE